MFTKTLNRIRSWALTPVENIVNYQSAQIVDSINDLVHLSERIEVIIKNVELIDKNSNDLIKLTKIDVSNCLSMLSNYENKTKETDLITAGLSARAARLRQGLGSEPGRRVAARPLEYGESLARLRKLNPVMFPVWMELFENGARSYVEERLGSCSHREHYYAQLFGAYCEIYGHGRILDIGCGPHGMPSYLATRDPRLVTGLEPLEMRGAPVFDVARGFNEFLPWEDGQFDTVVSGTSLDHVLSLKASLAEVSRVLHPAGRYLVWLASIPGAAPFDENATEFQPIDRFHLFHFDRTWIEPIFEEFFEIDDVTIIPQPGFDHVFYCMTPGRQPPAGTAG